MRCLLKPIAAMRRVVFPFSAMAVLLAFALAGCARVKDGSSPPPLSLTVQMDRENATLRSGEALIVHAWVRNHANRSLTIQMLDASSVEFFVSGPAGAVRARPVVSAREPMGLTYPVAAGHALPERRARAFVFTTVAQKPGPYHLVAIYHPAPKGAESDLEPVIAKSVPFRVEGEVLLRRDRDGILLKENAIGIAGQHAGRPTTAAEALLLDTDNGFLLWRVALASDPNSLSPGKETRQVVYVNPYIGTIMPIGETKTPPPKTPEGRPSFEPIQILPPPQP